MEEKRERMRVSMHSGRCGSAQHNDRTFLEGMTEQERAELAAHINLAASAENEYFTWNGSEESFKENELKYYKERFSAACEITNQKYRKEGHPEKCRTPEDFYKNKKLCPEEIILQIGDKDCDIKMEDFRACINEYISRIDEWNEEHGGPFVWLSGAIHVDETSLHCHLRRVWEYRDKDGLVRIGQDKALEAAGVNLPHPEKKKGRHNNRKINFDQMAREIWQQVCIEHGYEIETEPRPGVKHKDKVDYISSQIQAEIEELKVEKEDLKREKRRLQEEKEVLIREKKDLQIEKEAAMGDLQKTIDLRKQIYEEAIREIEKNGFFFDQAREIASGEDPELDPSWIRLCRQIMAIISYDGKDSMGRRSLQDLSPRRLQLEVSEFLMSKIKEIPQKLLPELGRELLQEEQNRFNQRECIKSKDEWER